jgi:hypothetical protein
VYGPQDGGGGNSSETMIYPWKGEVGREKGGGCSVDDEWWGRWGECREGAKIC